MSTNKLADRYRSKGRTILGDHEQWRIKHCASVFDYNHAAEKAGLEYYTRHWWNVLELYRAVRYLISKR